ncbi:MAG: hypothetical protein ACLUE1_03595 [Adlercreutzia equolifaciens]
MNAKSLTLEQRPTFLRVLRPGRGRAHRLLRGGASRRCRAPRRWPAPTAPSLTELIMAINGYTVTSGIPWASPTAARSPPSA